MVLDDSKWLGNDSRLWRLRAGMKVKAFCHFILRFVVKAIGTGLCACPVGLCGQPHWVFIIKFNAPER